ncbi:MAG: hypothetical protein CMI73_04145 [Candidatus Pelagibacter sp.]|nr:hypothetical protein [Candidatus Pelagibacter sp.]|tara:strand:- start:810 stop:1007 length:198 start_codon:yes stop_codon:yes gene_type:complete
MDYNKKNVSFEIYTDTDEMLSNIVLKYNLKDKSKAIRCLLDFVSEEENNWDNFFKKKRCYHCKKK